MDFIVSEFKKELISNLQALPRREISASLTAYDVVEMARTEVLHLRIKNWDWKSIAEELTNQCSAKGLNIKLSSSSLQKYMHKTGGLGCAKGIEKARKMSIMK